MDENRVAGTVKNVGGKVEEGFGRATGNTRARTEGRVNQAGGAAQRLYGQARDGIADTAATLETWLRRIIETQPYTTAMVSIALAWLPGQMHRPL